MLLEFPMKCKKALPAFSVSVTSVDNRKEFLTHLRTCRGTCGSSQGEQVLKSCWLAHQFCRSVVMVTTFLLQVFQSAREGCLLEVFSQCLTAKVLSFEVLCELLEVQWIISDSLPKSAGFMPPGTLH